ncbi:hypothetical protein BZA77DRAFT_111651 [Pyronema omphalodes]|nr:hypothetical protein BZA77DRAFT_111651 [Pyronema omphalodes]
MSNIMMIPSRKSQLEMSPRFVGCGFGIFGMGGSCSSSPGVPGIRLWLVVQFLREGGGAWCLVLGPWCCWCCCCCCCCWVLLGAGC